MALCKAYTYSRMSTIEQLKGDSKRRQVSAAEKYAQEKGLDIVERFDDWGVSAFRGNNAKFGSLARFTQRVTSGEISPGSYLLVESMDRLSRQEVPLALGHLLGIITSGIIVATLDDNREYSLDSLKSDPYGLMVALGGMARAHEESRRKAGLVSSAWQEKKRRAREEGVVATKRIPSWLAIDPQSRKVVPIPDRVAIIQEIFSKTRDGWGAYSLARHLNQRREPTWGSRPNSVWRESYVKKIIASRTVLGEYQPHRITHDQGVKARVADGEPIVNYYPPVVGVTLFREANSAVAKRRISGRGRKGTKYTNLFSGFLRCQCGAGYRYIDKGPPPKGGQYLQCSVAHAKGSCSMAPLRYRVVENLLLSVLESIDIERVMGGQAMQTRLAEKRHLLADAIERLEFVEKRVSRVLTAILSDDAAPSKLLGQQAKQLEVEREEISQEIERLSREIDELNSLDPSERQRATSGLLQRIRADDGSPQDEATRRALVGELQRLIQTVEIKSDMHLSWELIASDPDWKRTYNVPSEAALEKLLRETGFALTISYRSGNTQIVEALSGLNLLLKGGRRFEDLKFVTSSRRGL